MERLFSYGTLQQAEVQQATFGRLLAGTKDALPGFELANVLIEDPGVVATSGKTHHPIARFNGSRDSRIAGTLFEITAGELADADRYEVSAYRRISATLASGLEAWVYVDAHNAGPQPPTA